MHRDTIPPPFAGVCVHHLMIPFPLFLCPWSEMTGLYLAVLLALPAGMVVTYFNLKGDWDRAFMSAAVFIGCGLILTSVRRISFLRY
jgi:hypothetical protein